MTHLIVLVQLKQNVCSVGRSPTATARRRCSMKYEHSLDHIQITFYYIQLFFIIEIIFSVSNHQNRMFYSIKLLIINTVVYI